MWKRDGRYATKVSLPWKVLTINSIIATGVMRRIGEKMYSRLESVIYVYTVGVRFVVIAPRIQVL